MATALKSRTETDARKEDSVIFVLISRTNFSTNFVRGLSTKFRDLNAVTMQLNPGKLLKIKKRQSGSASSEGWHVQWEASFSPTEVKVRSLVAR
jgi:replicative DNA helicase